MASPLQPRKQAGGFGAWGAWNAPPQNVPLGLRVIVRRRHLRHGRSQEGTSPPPSAGRVDAAADLPPAPGGQTLARHQSGGRGALCPAALAEQPPPHTSPSPSPVACPRTPGPVGLASPGGSGGLGTGTAPGRGQVKRGAGRLAPEGEALRHPHVGSRTRLRCPRRSDRTWKRSRGSEQAWTAGRGSTGVAWSRRREIGVSKKM